MKVRFIPLLLLAALLCVSFSGCGGNKPREVSSTVPEIYSKLVATGHLPAMTPVSERDMGEIYGIDTEKIRQSAFYLSENYSVLADEVAIFEAVDEAYAEEVLGILQARLKSKADVAATYSPEEYAKIMKTTAYRVGSYVYFVVCDEYDALMNIMRSEIG